MLAKIAVRSRHESKWYEKGRKSSTSERRRNISHVNVCG